MSPARFSENDSAPPERLSKTRRKAAMHELQDLGEALTQLSREQLRRFESAGDYADLLDAVRHYQSISGFEARRRQLQFIGKLMRGQEPESIRLLLAEARGDSAEAIARLHRLERLREKFLEDEKGGLADILAAYPDADLTRFRQLRRGVLKEREEARPPRLFRELFQTLKALDAARTSETE